MRLGSLKHLAEVVRSMARPEKIVVMGSSAFLASYPELDKDDGPLAGTYVSMPAPNSRVGDIRPMTSAPAVENRGKRMHISCWRTVGGDRKFAPGTFLGWAPKLSRLAGSTAAEKLAELRARMIESRWFSRLKGD